MTELAVVPDEIEQKPPSSLAEIAEQLVVFESSNSVKIVPQSLDVALPLKTEINPTTEFPETETDEKDEKFYGSTLEEIRETQAKKIMSGAIAVSEDEVQGILNRNNERKDFAEAGSNGILPGKFDITYKDLVVLTARNEEVFDGATTNPLPEHEVKNHLIQALTNRIALSQQGGNQLTQQQIAGLEKARDQLQTFTQTPANAGQ